MNRLPDDCENMKQTVVIEDYVIRTFEIYWEVRDGGQLKDLAREARSTGRGEF